MSSVRTQRLRYQAAVPLPSSTPCTMPSPTNQWYGPVGVDERVRADAQVAAAQLGRDRAVDPRSVVGALLVDRAVVAGEERVLGEGHRATSSLVVPSFITLLYRLGQPLDAPPQYARRGVNLVRIATWSEVPDGVPTAAMAENVDLVIVRRGDEHSVLHGRCLHRGALLADGHIVGRRSHLRPARLGLPHRVGRERVQQRRGAREVHVGRRGRRAVRRSRRRDPLEAAASAALQPRRVPGALHGSARHDRRAVRDADPRARGARPRKGRPPRLRRRDGRAAPAAADVGRRSSS